MDLKLKSIIESQKNSIFYRSHDYTVKHKLAVYLAFQNLHNTYVKDFESYIFNSERGFGFQYKLFQEYVIQIEKELPFILFKNGKYINISSLLDSDLGIFCGISNFQSFVDHKLEIKNLTTDLFSNNKPYYMGKILSIENENNKSLINNIDHYTFHKIIMKDIKPFTKVNVSHLTLPPHYQIGAMSYINRIRKEIIAAYKEESLGC